MKIDPALMDTIVVYVLEKIEENNSDKSKANHILTLIKTTEDPTFLLDLLSEHYPADVAANELRRNVVSEKDYYSRKALLIQVEYILSILKTLKS
jgi:hypothetical protein